MIDIKIETYYHDQLSEAVDDAFEWGTEKKAFAYLGMDGDGQETFIVWQGSLPDDLYDFLTEEFEEEGGLEIGKRTIDTSIDEEGIVGNTHEINIHY